MTFTRATIILILGISLAGVASAKNASNKYYGSAEFFHDQAQKNLSQGLDQTFQGYGFGDIIRRTPKPGDYDHSLRYDADGEPIEGYDEYCAHSWDCEAEPW